MKKLTIILVLALFSVHAISQTDINSLLSLNQEEREYKTKRPKEIVETNIFYNSSGKQIEQIDKNTKTFDDAGMLLVEERSDKMGNLSARLTYINDTINRLQVARIFERWYHWGGYSKETAYFSYDENNFLFNWTDMDANGKVMFVTFILNNANGDPIELSLIDGNGNLYGKETATYDYDRNEVIIKGFSNKGKLLSKVAWTIDFSKAYLGSIFNEHGDIIKSVDASGKRGYLYEYSYDIYGNCTEKKIYKATFKKSGKEKKTIDRIFRKEYTYCKSLRNPDDENADVDTTLDKVDEMPLFNGKPVEEGFRIYVAQNTRYPIEAIEKRISGRVFVSFIIDTDGSLIDAEIERGVHPLLDAEALRVINTSPKWKPGKRDGVPVRVQYTFPVVFRMAN